MAAFRSLPSLMSKRAILLLVIAAIAAGLGLWVSQRHFAVPVAAPPSVASFNLLPTPRTLPAFSLQQSDGTPLTGDELKGHWTLVFLGFTHCPDVCPTTLALFRQIETLAQAEADAPRPALWFISVDPARDTPQVLGDYARYFSPAIVAATGTEAALAALTPALGIVHAQSPTPDGAYTVDHSTQILVFDPQGRLAAIARPPHDAAAILADLRSMAVP